MTITTFPFTTNNAVPKDSSTLSITVTDLYTASFNSENSNCINNLVTIAPPPTTVYTYEVFSPEATFPLLNFTTSPTCDDLTLEFSTVLKYTSDGITTEEIGAPGNLPAFIAIDDESIKVQTDDVSFAMEYHISVAGYVTTPRTMSGVTFYIINITNPCVSAVLEIAEPEYFYYARMGANHL